MPVLGHIGQSILCVFAGAMQTGNRVPSRTCCNQLLPCYTFQEVRPEVRVKAPCPHDAETHAKKIEPPYLCLHLFAAAAAVAAVPDAVVQVEGEIDNSAFVVNEPVVPAVASGHQSSSAVFWLLLLGSPLVQLHGF